MTTRRDEAERMCAQIAAYWRDQGALDVQVWIERLNTGRPEKPVPHYCVCTNLIAGLPPAWYWHRRARCAEAG